MELTLRLPTDPKIPSTDDDEQEIHEKALKENWMAMTLLNTALVGDALGIFITKTYTEEYPRGIACMVWKVWRNDINRMESISDFNKELNAISMTREADPNIMIDELEALSARYNTLGLKIPEDTFVARALVLAPSKYASALTAERE
jgi:hypothetical protein